VPARQAALDPRLLPAGPVERGIDLALLDGVEAEQRTEA
jgi:hypothetical protein